MPINKLAGIKAYAFRQYAAPLILLGATVIAFEAKAGCAYVSGYGKSTATLSLPANLALQRNTPAGTILWDSGNVMASVASNISCTGSNNATYSYSPYFGSSEAIPGMFRVYKTGLKGIGIRVSLTNHAAGTPSPIEIPAKSSVFPADRYIPLAVYRIELIASGEVTEAGALTLPTPLANMYYGAVLATELMLSNASVSVTSTSCSLNSTSINVPLGDVAASKFTGIATTAGDKSFDVGLSCDKNARINVSLAATQNTDTTETSVLALTGAGQTGTATGIGVQLLYGGTPLKINNNVALKTSTGGQETLPFTARYYQTQAAVGAGLANSSATLNITYQ
jgi:type 1 fimbria pilin